MFFNLKGRSKKIVALLLCTTMMCSANIATAFATEEVGPDFDLNVETVAEQDLDAATVESAADVNEDLNLESEEADSEDAVSVETLDAKEDVASDTKADEADNQVSADSVDVEEDFGEILEETVSADEIDAANASLDSNVNTLSDDNITISTNEAEKTSTGFVISKPAGSIDKKYRAKITWKKPKGAKGKMTYYVYRMTKDGKFPEQPTITTAKTKFIDTEIGTSDDALVYKVVPEGGYLDKYNIIRGDAYYIVVAPLLVNVERQGYVSDNGISIDVNFTDLKISENMVRYELKRATKNKKTYYTTVSQGDLNGLAEGHDSKPVIKPKYGTPDIVRITDNQFEEHEYGKKYFYKVVATVNIDGVDYSSESKQLSTTVYERAPRSVSAVTLTGTKVFLYWEDMTGNGGALAKQALLEDDDQYQIYYRLNGGKLKKYKTLQVADIPVLDTLSSNVSLTPYDRSDVNVSISSNGYYTAYYTCADLKANGTYEFFVAPVREKKLGGKTGSNPVITDILDLNSLSVDQLDDKSLTVKWNTVEGASKYNLYYKKCGTLAEAAEVTRRWQAMDGAPTDADKKVKVKQSKEKTVTYQQKKLTSGDVYAFKVIPVRGKSGKASVVPLEIGSERDNKDKTNINTGYGMLRLATPIVKVKEENGKITYSWKKVKGAAGYAIYSAYSGAASEMMDKYGYIEDGKAKQINTTTVTTKELGFDNLILGKGASIQVIAYAAKSPLYNNPDQKNYLDTDNYCSRRSKVATGYNRPQTPEDSKAVFNEMGTGAILKLKSGYNEKDLAKTVLGYKIMRSYTGKNFTTISANYTGKAVAGITSLDYKDMDMLTDGKTVYYRVYSVAVPYGYDVNNEYNHVVSKKYLEIKYCQPTKITKDTTTVKVGETAKITINFKPSATTMRQMDAWHIGDTSDNQNLELNSGKYVTTNNGVIKAIASSYDDAGTAGFSETIKVVGLKTGKAYVQAKTKNGLTAVFRIDVVSSTSKKNKDKESGDGKTIVLDPGHGGSDGGASNGSLKESEINLKISQYTQDILEKEGFTVYLTRSSDKYVDLAARVKYAKEKNATAIISQHINSGGSSGSECYYSIDGTGRSLAEKMTSYTSKEVGITNRGAKTRKNNENKDYYAIIRYARSDDKDYGGKKITGIIMENAFIDGDASILKDDAKLKAIAEANAKAIIEVYK